MELPEQKLHRSSEGLKVDLIIERSLVLDVAKQGHPNDGVDERDEGKQGSNVKQRRKGYNQCKEQFPDSLGGFDQP